jgi:hypothetical protein
MIGTRCLPEASGWIEGAANEISKPPIFAIAFDGSGEL